MCTCSNGVWHSTHYRGYVVDVWYAAAATPGHHCQVLAICELLWDAVQQQQASFRAATALRGCRLH